MVIGMYECVASQNGQEGCGNTAQDALFATPYSSAGTPCQLACIYICNILEMWKLQQSNHGNSYWRTNAAHALIKGTRPTYLDSSFLLSLPLMLLT